tara:strand:- start:184 stop:372 length:189 start_codon:yes stop_codon:yes gene_type:complete
MWNVVRFIGYTLGGYLIKSSWNWLTEDVDPEPGTKDFADKYRKITNKYKQLRRKDETYRRNG